MEDADMDSLVRRKMRVEISVNLPTQKFVINCTNMVQTRREDALEENQAAKACIHNYAAAPLKMNVRKTVRKDSI